METEGKNILVLGGWGLVGTAICRVLIKRKPKTITIASLTRDQAESACQSLAAIAGDIELIPAWGNIFVRSEMKDLTRSEILGSREYRLRLAEDVLERTSATSFHKFTLYKLICDVKPEIIIDCVNTATGVAYQDVYSAALKVLTGVRQVHDGNMPDDLLVEVEKLLDTLYLPQLVRHVQVLYQAMKEVGTHSYIKVGTSGTGGMGLNIPYTHSEDKPSRVLLSKSSIAGAHSLLLFLMGRTPDAPFTKEVKPATAIAWKRIAYGDILRHGQPIPLYDCQVDQSIELKNQLDTNAPESCWQLDENLRGVFIDTGENGTFSLGEFTAITTYEQMEYITPEEIAQTVVWEIEGGPTGHDIVSALDASILGPTYRAGFMRAQAIEKMRKLAEDHNDPSIAYELLGPPRLSKLLYEAYLLKRVAGSIKGVLSTTPDDLSNGIAELLTSDTHLRSHIISIGIPILLPDGKRLLRGPMIKVPSDPRKSVFDVSSESIENWCYNGWVDLRIVNMQRWHDRLKAILEQAGESDGSDTSSNILRDMNFWHSDQPLDEGELVGWIFIHEDEGRRIK